MDAMDGDKKIVEDFLYTLHQWRSSGAARLRLVVDLDSQLHIAVRNERHAMGGWIAKQICGLPVVCDYSTVPGLAVVIIRFK